MDESLVKLLEDSGFTQKEAQVYLALLELSSGTVTEISKSTGLKRSIIYVILEGLIKRGYASQIPNMAIETYTPADPSLIFHKIKTTAQNFSEMLPYLRTLGNRGKNKPKITYHESLEGIWNVYEEMTRSPEAFYITSYDRIEKNFPGAFQKWMKGYKRSRIKQNARHLISEDGEEIKIGREVKAIGQDVRTLKVLKNNLMDFTLFGNKLSITSLGENPFVVLIDSEEITNSMRPIFEIAWAAGKEIN